MLWRPMGAAASASSVTASRRRPMIWQQQQSLLLRIPWAPPLLPTSHAAAAATTLLLLAATTTATAAAAFHAASPASAVSSMRPIHHRPPQHRCYATTASNPDLPAACWPHTLTGRPARHLLVVGDGDFSFSRAILPSLPPTTERLVTTCLHPSQGVLVDRYPTAAANLDALTRGSDAAAAAVVRVGFGVDATDLVGTLRRAFDEEEGQGFDRIVWNFPHIVGKANVAANRRLLAAFLRNAAPLLGSSDSQGGGEVLLALCRGQSGVEARDARAYKASWQLALAASGAGLAIVGSEPFVGLEALYRPSGHRDQGADGGDGDGDREYVYHTRDPRIYTLVPSGGAGLPLRPVTGPAFTHELHLWCHASLLALPPSALEERLAAAARKCVAAAAAALDGAGAALKAKAAECLAGLRFVESYRPPTGSPSSSPDPASYPESRAYLLTWAWQRGGALTRMEADALRLAVERGIEGALDGKGVVRRGKTGFGVRDVTFEGAGLWGP